MRGNRYGLRLVHSVESTHAVVRPLAWVLSDGTIEVTARCRTCDWECNRSNLGDEDVHAALQEAGRLLADHMSGPASPVEAP